jgi:uncharacterized protein (TIGR02611 family)
MSKLTSGLRKVLFGILGSIVLILGIILLPLPGPGLLVCLLGLFLLSLEFDWAKPHMERIKRRLRGFYKDFKDKVDDKSQ